MNISIIIRWEETAQQAIMVKIIGWRKKVVITLIILDTRSDF